MRVIKVLVVHLVFIVIFLLVIDHIAALFLSDPVLGTPALSTPGERTPATWPLRSDPVTGWALAPPPDTPADMHKGFQISHTGIGLRWLPGTTDMGPPLVLLVLGDEMAFGANVKPEDTFGGWIKRSMEEHLTDRTVAVANAAVPGYDALQMYLQFKRLAAVRPHLALFCYSGGQTLAPETQTRRPTGLKSVRIREMLYRPALTRVLFMGLDRLTGGEEVTGISWRLTRDRIREPDAEEFADILKATMAHADRHKIPLLMMNLGLPEACRSVLESACTEAKVAHVDGEEALLDHLKGLSSSSGSAGTTEAAEGVTGQDGAPEPHSWWVRKYLRPRMAPLFSSRVYFSPALLPTRVSYRTVGDALTMAILEGDLFSWRHRVLR